MALSLFTSPAYCGLFGDAEIADCLSGEREVAAMIRFERALARVQGRLGVIPSEAGEGIDTALRETRIEPAALSDGVTATGVPVPALVATLRAGLPAEHGQWLHWGATSQDVMDTALILQTRECLDILGARLGRLITTLEEQSNANAGLVMAGRTRGQIATPITLGLRIAQWAHPLIDTEAALPALRRRVLRVQFGGASGANTAIAPHGPAISAALADELGLEDSPPWHVNRTGILALAAWLAGLSASLSKFAGDLVLLGRSEIAELRAGTGGGSSTMPQKANPVAAETIVTLGQIAAIMQTGLTNAASPAEERDGAKWALEWACLPQLVVAAGAALRHAQDLAETLTPDAARMAQTVAANDGVMAEAASFALARHMPRAEAQKLVKSAAGLDLPLPEALAQLSDAPVDWTEALDPNRATAPSRAIAAQIFARRT